MLDALLQIAQAKGFPGGRALVLRILQVGGRFNVGMTPNGSVAVFSEILGVSRRFHWPKFSPRLCHGTKGSRLERPWAAGATRTFGAAVKLDPFGKLPVIGMIGTVPVFVVFLAAGRSARTPATGTVATAGAGARRRRGRRFPCQEHGPGPAQSRQRHCDRRGRTDSNEQQDQGNQQVQHRRSIAGNRVTTGRKG